MANEQELFLQTWEAEAKKTVALLSSLPVDQYDFRPDPMGRSIGEMAWHLAEGDAYMTYAVEKGSFAFGDKPPSMARPRTIAELAPGYERIHSEAVARVKKLELKDFDRTLTFFDGQPMAVRDILRSAVLHHHIHHRGQLVLMCRLSGTAPPGLYGPNREDMAKMAEAMKSKS